VHYYRYYCALTVAWVILYLEKKMKWLVVVSAVLLATTVSMGKLPSIAVVAAAWLVPQQRTQQQQRRRCGGGGRCGGGSMFATPFRSSTLSSSATTTTTTALCLSTATTTTLVSSSVLDRNKSNSTSTCRSSSSIHTITDKDTVPQAAAAAAATATTANPQLSWRDDGFVFGLDHRLERPKNNGGVSVVVEGDALETQPYQVSMVLTATAWHACVTLISLSAIYSQSVAAATLNVFSASLYTALALLVCGISTWLAADLGSGVLHWAVDNYGNGRTAIFGKIIAAFQGHHSAPHTITKRDTYNNVYPLTIPFGLAPLVLFLGLAGWELVQGSKLSDFASWSWWCGIPSLWLTLFSVWELYSQEFHKWSHSSPRDTPAIGTWLQRYGVAVPRTMHARHHARPFEGNYCIVSGICNPWLDNMGFFRRCEYVIYHYWTGVEANAWKLDAELRRRTLAGDFGPVTSSLSSPASPDSSAATTTTTEELEALQQWYDDSGIVE
jgi:palmitoyl-[glycerolipid] 3-(E)-desaturase